METSAFMKLPGELRNRIYEMALQLPEGLTIRVLTGKPQLVESDRNHHILALSSTCTQTRRECSTLVYELNKVNIIAKPSGQRYTELLWQQGLRHWLAQIGEQNRQHLCHVEIDIGTSFMHDLYPSSETIWRGVSALLCLFPQRTTRVSMKTDVNWMSRSRKTFPVVIPLDDVKSAHLAVREVVKQQRIELELWFRTAHIGAREIGYRRMELETCGQELRSFITLLETANAIRLG